MIDHWLDAANPADLESLANSLRDGRLVPPYTTSAVQNTGIPEAAAWLAQWGETPPTMISWALDRIAKERRASDNRYASAANLVWSGPSEEQGTRDTRIVLKELFDKAEHHVLISTYVIYNGKAIFEPLAARLRKKPDIEVELYVNLLPGNTCKDERQAVSQFLDVFEREHWPTDVKQPAIYYAPENMKTGTEHVTLHAKCVVVDYRWAFVTSANFTEAAQDRNIEAGVLMDHAGIAGALAGRFRGLSEGGRLRRMG